ncbi:isochorismatase family protein [Mycoplasma todarodis]|uniref:isochorismatase family protein n=1 Tax=Mycoplasma todarodis TaxID=1937191 RepID=UPI003B2A6D98
MKKCLLIVDMQNDFSEEGALPVAGFSELIQGINKKIEEYKNKEQLVVLTKDWHPENHISFVGSTWDQSLQTELWPKHCVQDSFGAMVDKRIQLNKVDYIVHKGDDQMIDSYSVFQDANKNWNDEIKRILKREQVEELEIVGVAGEFCVKYTAIDAIELGYKVFANQQLTKYIDQSKKEAILKEFDEKQIKY